MSFDEVAQKFRDSARFPARPLHEERADRVVEAVRHLEEMPDATRLLDALTWQE